MPSGQPSSVSLLADVVVVADGIPGARLASSVSLFRPA